MLIRALGLGLGLLSSFHLSLSVCKSILLGRILDVHGFISIIAVVIKNLWTAGNDVSFPAFVGPNFILTFDW